MTFTSSIQNEINRYPTFGSDSSDEEYDVADYNGTKAKENLEKFNQIQNEIDKLTSGSDSSDEEDDVADYNRAKAKEHLEKFNQIQKEIDKLTFESDLSDEEDDVADYNGAKAKENLEKFNQIQNEIDKYSTFGSDSSDEEDDVADYNGAKAKENLEKFNQIYIGSKFPHNNLSFITHSVAIKFLYSPQIQEAYYKKKKELKNCFELPDQKKLEIGIARAAEHVVRFQPQLNLIEVHYNIWKTINNDLNGFFNALVNKTLSNFFEILTVSRDRGGDYGYYEGNLLGWLYTDELGQLRISLKDRPTITLDVSQSERFFVDFFSTLRLHNRLDKRKIKHHNESSLQDTKWKYSDNVEVIINHGIHRYTNIYRKEEVLFSIGKEDVTASYEQIYNNSLLTMRDLDELPNIFTTGSNQISRNAASLHYLLFGTEIMRNPSALIHNMMILDLIKSGRLTWKDAFITNVMPSSIKGAIMASRMKNSKYNEKYMPHKYLYDHPYEEYVTNYFDDHYKAVANLLNKEKTLTAQWLEMKLGKKCLKMCLDEKDDVKMECVEFIFNILETSCQDWYHVVDPPPGPDKPRVHPDNDSDSDSDSTRYQHKRRKN